MASVSGEWGVGGYGREIVQYVYYLPLMSAFVNCGGAVAGVMWHRRTGNGSEVELVFVQRKVFPRLHERLFYV